MLQICNTMMHEGELLAKAVKDAGITIQHFAKLMGVSRNTPARWFDMPGLPVDKLFKTANVLNVDPAALFPSLRTLSIFDDVSQPLHNQEGHIASSMVKDDLSEALQKCTIEKDEWKTKAYEAMEKYAKLLEAYSKLITEEVYSPTMEKGSANQRVNKSDMR